MELTIIEDDTLSDKIFKYIKALGLPITEEEFNDIYDALYNVLGDQELYSFVCPYCDCEYPQSKGIVEHLTDDITRYICEHCYIEGIDSVL